MRTAGFLLSFENMIPCCDLVAFEKTNELHVVIHTSLNWETHLKTYEYFLFE